MKLDTITDGEITIHPDAVNGNCVTLAQFEYLNQLGEGTYGVVYRARDKRDNSIVALKTVRIFESDKGEGIPITALREISILKSLRHHNVISVLEVAVGAELDEIFMVEEYAEQDMANILDTVQVKFTTSEAKCLVKQLFEGLQYKIIHRDLKMSNLLLTRHGILKIADFGMARAKAGWMTPQPVTIWYRAPELLFGSQVYSYSVDMWSAGCILAELLTSQPLLPGSDEKEEMSLIVRLLGPPSELSWPGFKRLPWGAKFSSLVPLGRKIGIRLMFQAETAGLIGLLESLILYNPDSRLTAKEALLHKYFKESPAAQDPALLPTFPEVRNESSSRDSMTFERKSSFVIDNSAVDLGHARTKKRRVDK